LCSSIQHFFERNQPLLQLSLQLFLAGSPAIYAATAKFAFFMPQETQMVGHGHHFEPINVIQLESHTFDIILNVPP
jgi:hypothetical protein